MTVYGNQWTVKIDRLLTSVQSLARIGIAMLMKCTIYSIFYSKDFLWNIESLRLNDESILYQNCEKKLNIYLTNQIGLKLFYKQARVSRGGRRFEVSYSHRLKYFTDVDESVSI